MEAARKPSNGNPEPVNEDPDGQGWLGTVQPTGGNGPCQKPLDADAYLGTAQS